MKTLILSCCIFCFTLLNTPAHTADTEPVLLENSNSISACQGSDQISATFTNTSFSQQFLSFWSGLLDTTQWPARWYCGNWSSFHGWLYISSDLAIWLAYFMIPLVMGYFIYKKKSSIPYKSVYVLFILFILACGLTHLIDAAIFWWPAYRLSAVLRFTTAIISWGSVFALIKVVPDALTLPSHGELINEVNQRKTAEEKLELKLEELEAINSELESFSYSVSHDLRSPLRTIHGFTNALIEDYEKDLNDEAKDYLNRVSNASIRMGHLIDDMLDLSRISRKQIVISSIDITALTKEIVKDLKYQTQTKADFVIEENLHTEGDAGLIRIVIENLIANSIKYAARDRPTKIEIGMTKEDGAFYVKDNGVGFDMEYVDKIFGAFQRLHDSSFEGTGIGLATVKRIINRHKGKIWAESKVGKGSAFFFTLGTNLSMEG